MLNHRLNFRYLNHEGISKKYKLTAGITDNPVRFSVGIEDVEDINEDLMAYPERMESLGKSRESVARNQKKRS